VKNVTSTDSALGIFPFRQRWQCVWCGETPPTGPTWTHDAEAESISLTDRDSAVAQLFWVYFTVTCFSLRVFYRHIFGCCSWVAVFSQYASGEYCIHMIGLLFSIQYHTYNFDLQCVWSESIVWFWAGKMVLRQLFDFARRVRGSVIVVWKCFCV